MRRRSKELNIFSMSALDLFASAMGAFILITLILMPYYLKESPVPDDGFGPEDCPIIEVPQCPVCPSPQPIDTPTCPVCPTPNPVDIPECPPPTNEIEISDNLLVFIMSWDEEVDIDLHIKTPDGEFSYEQKTISGAPGEIKKDDVNGGEGSVEVWISQGPSSGDYEIYFNNYDESPSARVYGSLYKPSGEVRIAPFVLDSNPRTVLKFSISNDFEYTETFRGP